MYRSNDGMSFTAMLHCAPISRMSPAENTIVVKRHTEMSI